jgi:hypothetical protein
MGPYAALSAIGRVPAQAWERAHRGIGGTFKMEWLCLFDLPFNKAGLGLCKL